MDRIGNLEVEKVLDVAYGKGFSTRKLRQAGADEVVDGVEPIV